MCDVTSGLDGSGGDAEVSLGASNSKRLSCRSFHLIQNGRRKEQQERFNNNFVVKDMTNLNR